MNEIVNKFSLAGDKFMPEMHLKQPGFTCSACGPFSKNKEKIQKFKQTRDTSQIYKNELDKDCFQHDMAYGDFKDLTRRTASDNVLRVKHLILLKILNMTGIKEGLLLWFINLLIKSRKVVVLIYHQSLKNNQLKNYKKRTVYLGFKDNTWGADLADMQLISKFNKGFRFLLCVIDIFSKYARVFLLKDKEGVSIVDAFQKILDKSARKPKNMG